MRARQVDVGRTCALRVACTWLYIRRESELWFCDLSQSLDPFSARCAIVFTCESRNCIYCIVTFQLNLSRLTVIASDVNVPGKTNQQVYFALIKVRD